MARNTKKNRLKTELTELGIIFLSKDNTETLEERLNAHKEKRPFKQPKKKPSPFQKKPATAGGSKGSKTAVAETPAGYKHSNGKIYTFKPNRTNVILRGQKYTPAEALANAKVMDELIERRHTGLTWV